MWAKPLEPARWHTEASYLVGGRGSTFVDRGSNCFEGFATQVGRWARWAGNPGLPPGPEVGQQAKTPREPRGLGSKRFVGQVADCHVSHEQDGPHFTKTGQHGHVSHVFHVADCHVRHEGRGPKKVRKRTECTWVTWQIATCATWGGAYHVASTWASRHGQGQSVPYLRAKSENTCILY